MSSSNTSMWRRTRTSMTTGSSTGSYSKTGSTYSLTTAGAKTGGPGSVAPTTNRTGAGGVGSTQGGGTSRAFSKAASVRSKAGSSAASAMSGTGDDRASMPSFWSIWTTRRMVRALTSRLRNRRRPGGSDRTTRMVEPTYRMEPKQVFNSAQVEKVIGDVLEAHLHDFTYDAKRCKMLTRIIIEEIKDRVKALRFERYKIVCAATMGEKKGQDLRVASRCIWDTKFDTYSTYNWENSSAYCSVTVFGIYHE